MRYPTRNGLIISPYELGYTVPTPEDLSTRRRVNIHHGYWPWSTLNQNQVSRVFGSLISNTYPMLAEEHNMGKPNLHHEFSAPKLPHIGLMIDCVDEYLSLHGVIDCVRHKNTSQEYQLTASQWRGIAQVGYARAS